MTEKQMYELIDCVKKAVTDLGFFVDETCHIETGDPLIRVCNGPELYGSQDVAFFQVYSIPSRVDGHVIQKNKSLDEY